jgi:hypothetical protein
MVIGKKLFKETPFSLSTLVSSAVVVEWEWYAFIRSCVGFVSLKPTKAKLKSAVVV